MSKGVSRRQILKAAAALPFSGMLAPIALNLAGAESAAAQPSEGYRALVCLFLYGGNDHTNTVVPYDLPSYSEYFNARSSIALTRDKLAATSIGPSASQGGREFALHPALLNISRLYREGNAAIVANVGPLVVPTTKLQYQQRTVPLPPKLFSHNDQQSAWQGYAASGEGVPHGWGGTLGDELAIANTKAAFTCISAAGNAVFLSGRSVVQYQISASGALTMNAISGSLYGSAAAARAYRQLVTLDSRNLFEREMGIVNRRSIETNEILRAALPAPTFFTTPIPAGNTLAPQLNVVARMIAARNALGLSRQVFLVSLGGFDNHDFLLTEHAKRMDTVDKAINAFWAWLGQMGLQSNVTLFTASDFGRTLTSNGDGSDHGWGSHHFVIGGGVSGGAIYGAFPPTAYGTAYDVGHGKLLPSVAVDQLAGTLGRWMGVPDTNMTTAFPNIGHFDTRYLPLFGAV